MQTRLLKVLIAGLALGTAATAIAQVEGPGFYDEACGNLERAGAANIQTGLVRNSNGDCYAVEQICGPLTFGEASVELGEFNALDIEYFAGEKFGGTCSGDDAIQGRGWATTCSFENGGKYELRVNPVKAVFCEIKLEDE